MENKKYLSFDIGLHRTGVAINHGSLAAPLQTIKSGDIEELITKIEDLVRTHQPELIILGQPERGPIGELAQEVKLKLEADGFAVKLVDEHKSTITAQRLLISGGKSADKRKKIEHQVVASILLQEYLDNL